MKTLALALVLASALVSPALAQGCAPSTSEPTAQTPACGTADGACFYLDVECVQDCLSFWIYQESNGLPGLQRDDAGRDDTCGGMVASDTIVF